VFDGRRQPGSRNSDSALRATPFAWGRRLIVLGSLVTLTIVAGLAVLWVAGFRLFLRSQLSRARRISWLGFLLLVGIGIGVLLPLEQVWRRFVVLILGLPILAVADVWLLRSRRGLSFWVRACGFEVCTVFGTAAAARYLFELAGVAALVRPTR
jgi:hypothetical protein